MLPLPAEGSKVLRLAASRGGAPKRARAPSRAARLPSAAPGSIEGGGPETRSGTVQSLKCCPCQQKRAARLKGGGPETRSGTVQSLKCCPCQQKRAARLKSAAPGSIKGGGPRNALGHRPEPEVLPLPAENEPRGSKVLRLAASRGGAPKRARAPSRA